MNERNENVAVSANSKPMVLTMGSDNHRVKGSKCHNRICFIPDKPGYKSHLFRFSYI